MNNCLEIFKSKKPVRVISNPFLNRNEIQEILNEDRVNVLLGSASSNVDLRLVINNTYLIEDNFEFHYVLDGKDLSFINDNELNFPEFNKVSWLRKQVISADISFCNDSRLIIVAGGVLPSMHDWEFNCTDVELAYAEGWHEEYDGRFGYVCSNNSSKSNNVRAYNHSCAMMVDSRTSIIDFNEFGIESINYL
jgi:hypothetical protein